MRTENAMERSSFKLYQSARLSTYADRLIHGFTGKPFTLGGPGFSAEELTENRQKLCNEMGLTQATLVIPGQTHSANIRAHGEVCMTDTDAVLITEINQPALVLVADCVPIILYNPSLHVAAVIHAGWRGTAQAITAKTVPMLGGNPGDLIVAIGPCIGGCCYEVSPAVRDAVSETIPHINTVQYVHKKGDHNPHVDLKAVNRFQLESQGVTEIDILPNCTRCETDSLWSHRRGESGRNGVFVELR